MWDKSYNTIFEHVGQVPLKFCSNLLEYVNSRLRLVYYMDLKEAIAFRIKTLYEERGLNPSSLAYLCGMDRSTIYSILGSKSKNPEIATIKKICDGLEITLGEFFNSPEFDKLDQEIK